MKQWFRSCTMLAIGLALSLAFSGCGSSNNNPQPAILSISPSQIPVGFGQFTLSISGNNFSSTSTVHFGSDSLTPASVSTVQCPGNQNCPVVLQVVVPPGDIRQAGTIQVNVNSNSIDSKNVNFSVASPQIITESPLATAAGAPGFALTLTVMNVAQNVAVLFGPPGSSNSPLVPSGPVTCNSDTACSLTVQVPKSAIASAGTVPVTVLNPLAQSGGTASTNFVIVNASSASFPIEQSSNGSAQGNGSSSHSSVSDGGLFVAFDSTASNLAQGVSGGLSQIYVNQNCFGASGCTPQTTLISAGSGGPGSGGIAGSDKPVISPDGRYVAFESDDTNLVAGATSGIEQIYLFDTCNSIFGKIQNCSPKLTLVSADANGNTGNAPSRQPVISAFGLYVAFQSSATNLTTATTPANVSQIYLLQTCNAANGAVNGCKAGLQLLSTDASGNAGDKNSSNPAIDPAGIAVAFQSSADDIVSGQPANGSQQIYLRTTCLELVPFLAPPCQQRTILLSGDSGNNPGTKDSITPALTDANATLLSVFATAAPNLLPSNAAGQQILGETVCLSLPSTSSCAPSGLRDLSVDTSGMPAVGGSSNPSVSDTRAVFTSTASLVPPTGGTQVYAADLCFPLSSCPVTVSLLSADSKGNPLGGDFGAVGGGAFASFMTMNSPGANGVGEIFLADPPLTGAPSTRAKIRKSKLR